MSHTFSDNPRRKGYYALVQEEKSTQRSQFQSNTWQDMSKYSIVGYRERAKLTEVNSSNNELLKGPHLCRGSPVSSVFSTVVVMSSRFSVRVMNKQINECISQLEGHSRWVLKEDPDL